MNLENPLIVPTVVEAFVVNDHVRMGGTAYLRTQMLYASLASCGNGQPGLSNNDTNFTSPSPVPPNNIPSADFYNGVYLKWRLPKAFTHGEQDNVAGKTDFRTVPNRWLIVRYAGALNSRAAAAWIVESDYLWTSGISPRNIAQVPSRYVQPTSTVNRTPVAVNLGRNVALDSSTWSESGQSLHLTALAPGNPAFAYYQPQNNNVFSFVDVLNGQPPQSLSYLVLGWYSQPDQDDPLRDATEANFTATLDSLFWKVTDLGLFATRTLLCGAVNGVEWQTSLPPGGAPTGSPVGIAVGNTSVEALTAMITAQAAAEGKSLDTELLEAFQLNALDTLDLPDGAAELAERLRASFFQKVNGGYRWEIVDAPNANSTVPPEELEREMEWLAELNQAQNTLDSARLLLATLRTRLYTFWWKYADWAQAYQGSTVIPQLRTPDALKAQLDPSTSGTVAQLTAAQLDLVNVLAAKVPRGDTPKALQDSIDAYAAEHQLPATRLLKRADAMRFYEPNNPVVMIAGAAASGIVDDPGQITCRFPSQLVTGFRYGNDLITASTAGLYIPQPSLSNATGIPWTASLITSLVNEFFFTDPTNATIVSALIPGSTVDQVAKAMSDPGNDQGTYPAGGVSVWTANPWHPLLLYWEVAYTPITYGTPSSPNWTFVEGQYNWNGASGSIAQELGLSGTIQLAPTAAFNMRARIQQFLGNNPYLDPALKAEFEALLDFVQSDDSWDLLSQGLNGFNEQLKLLQPGVFLGPESTPLVSNPPLPVLIGDASGYAPGLENIPVRTIPPSMFQAWRAGQFVFRNLLVVDEWGQALWPITSNNYKNITLYLPPDLTPVLVSEPASLSIVSGPAVSSISPAAAAAGSDALTLTVNGAGFTSGSTVQWNGTALSTTFVSSDQLTAGLPAAMLTSATSASVSVSNSNKVPFQVTAGVAITSLSPDLVLAGSSPSAEFSLTVTGAGFAGDAAVQWNGAPLTTQVTSSTQVTAQVPTHLIFFPGTAVITVASGGSTSNTLPLTIAGEAAIGSLQPPVVSAGGSAFTLTVNGVGFQPASRLQWNGAALQTTYMSAQQLSASITADKIAQAGTASVTSIIGYRVLPDAPESLVQLPPAVLQPAQLDFEFVSATDDSKIQPLAPDVDPICGWVVPNHLDGSLLAYCSSGDALGTMSIGLTVSGQPTVCWTKAPYSRYTSLAQIAREIPHFGPFLLTLSDQSPATFRAFLRAIDETMWTTVPMGASFDQGMTVLMGRPLAMVRSRLQFQLYGAPAEDPSWQFTFNPAPPAIAGYAFGIQLGNLAQLEDGLIGYFTSDDYGAFNIVGASGAQPGSYLRPIGWNNNYIYLPFDGRTSLYLSMLVDPRASVHALTAILPDQKLTLPPEFVTNALASMNVTFRVNSMLTDQKLVAAQDDKPAFTTILMPTPQERTGTWSWIEYDGTQPSTYSTAPNDTAANLSNVLPVLRTGVLQLSSPLATPRTPRSLSARTRSPLVEPVRRQKKGKP